MKKKMALTLLLILCFITGCFAGSITASFFWEKLLEGCILDAYVTRICDAIAPMKQLKDGKPDSAMSSLKQQLESGLTSYEHFYSTFKRKEQKPEILNKARTILSEVNKEANESNHTGSGNLAPLVARP